MDFESETFIVGTLNSNGKAAGIATQQDAESGMLLVSHALRGEGFDASEDGTGRGTPIVTVPTLTGNGDAHSGFRDENELVIAFAQNQRDEVRTMEVAGALAAEPGMKQQTYLACFKGGQGSKAGGIGYSESLSPTLSTADSNSQLAPTLMQGAQVRRLMPIECERLQGFEDEYTNIPFNGKPAADGNRYKALGNSMAVPVMAWIGGRIQMMEDLLPEISNSEAT